VDAPAVPELPKEFGGPSEIDLLNWASNRVSPAMLEEIARNDRGEEAAEHLSALRAQLRARAPLGLLPWYPREVLELERWNEPDGLAGHWKRLLACTILLRNVGHVTVTAISDEEFFVETSSPAVIQLVCSAIVVEGEAPVLATRLLLWLYGAQLHPAFRPFVAFGIVLLAAHCRNLSVPRRTRHSKRRPEKPLSVDIATLSVWMIEVESSARELLGDEVRTEDWLFGLNGYEQRRQSWISTAQSILAGDDARELLCRVGRTP